MNFIITGLPRSGTQFLANSLNMSKKFSVVHDLNYGESLQKLARLCHNNLIEESISYALDRFNGKTNHGEVSGVFRHILLPLLEVSPEIRKAVALRHPEKTIISIANKESISQAIHHIGIIRKDLERLDKITSHDEVKVFKFEDFTRNNDSLLEIIDYLRIDDLSVEDIDLSKKINCSGYRFTVNDFPKSEVDKLRGEIGWFVEKYNLNYI